jgi:hypothetical protein
VRFSAALRSAVVVSAAVIAAGPAVAQIRFDGITTFDPGVAEIEAAFDVERGRPGGFAVLHAKLRDATGRQADAPLRVEADGGTVEAPVRVGPGVYTARVAVPLVLGARRSIIVLAAAGRGATTVTLPIGPGPAAAVEVDAPRDLPADGESRPLWIGVSDEHGNPSTEPPQVVVRRGTMVRAPVALAPGGWIVHYRPPRDTRAGEDVVRIRAGPATTSRILRLTPMVPVVSFGARGGVVFGTGAASPVLAGEAAAWRRVGKLHLGLVLGAAWWTNEIRRTVQGPGGPLELLWRRAWLPITLSAASRHALGSRVVATVSVGGGASVVTSRTALAGEPAVAETRVGPVATAGIELALRVGAGEPLVALQGAWLGDPGLGTIRGDARPVSMLLGYRLHAF